MNTFKVGDIVYLTPGKNKLSSYVNWAQELMESKDKCSVHHVSAGSVHVTVLEGKEKGREIHSITERFKKFGVDELEVEEL